MKYPTKRKIATVNCSNQAAYLVTGLNEKRFLCERHTLIVKQIANALNTGVSIYRASKGNTCQETREL